MPVYFFDTSALVKRYVAEPGSQRVIDILGASDAIVVIADITRAEFTSAVNRLVRQGDLPEPERQRLRTAFAAHLVHEYLVAPVTAAEITAACTLLERHPLRAYDAVQLASALAIRQLLGFAPDLLAFVSADSGLSTAARAEGVAVLDPV